MAEATENPEAHEAYLRGRYFWNQRTGEGIRSAITEFQRAIDLDPGYPEAHSGLADSYAVLDIYASVPDVRIVMEQAREAAQRAVALAPDLGMAHTSLAWAFTRLGEWENSESEFERAIGLSPGYATAHQWYGDLLRFTGRADEAVLVARRASEADPVSQIVNLDFGWALHIAGRAGEAVEQMRRTIELDPSWPRGWRDLSWILVEAGAYDEALDALLNSGADSARARERVEAVARYVETGEAQSLSFSPSLPWVAATGQRERALERVDRYVQERNYFQFAYSHRRGITGTSDLLGDDPRYQALLEEAGITW